MSEKTWTIKELLDVTITFLEEKEIPDPRLSAEILLAHQLGIERIGLYLQFDRPLNRPEVDGYRALIRRRLQREPVQYITGRQEFWSLTFAVGPRVLIPRSETELLIEQLIKTVREDKAQGLDCPPFTLLDLGTGSGAIAVAVASEFSQASVWASDISQGAIDQAASNAKRHGLEERIRFLVGDLFEPAKSLNLGFDFILTNPPYVAAEEYELLPPEIKAFEPRIALDGHQKGLFYIDRIIREAPTLLNEDGWLLMEMDPRQISLAEKLIEERHHYREVKPVRDYSHNLRLLVSRKQKPPA